MNIYSLAFPTMFSSGKTLVASNEDATMSNLKLLLASEVTSLFGDPGYGTALQRVIYSQNNLVLQDLIVDEIYTCIKTYMPQLIVKRENIQLTAKDRDLYAQIAATNALDYTLNLYNIQLTDTQEF